jgi:hypothetical protein
MVSSNTKEELQMANIQEKESNIFKMEIFYIKENSKTLISMEKE